MSEQENQDNGGAAPKSSRPLPLWASTLLTALGTAFGVWVVIGSAATALLAGAIASVIHLVISYFSDR